MTNTNELTAKLKAAAENAKDDFIPSFMVSTRDVLELIAALEAARADCRENAARIAELESQRALAFSACNRWADKCRDAEKRVAELETRTVKLPSINPQMFNDDVMFGYRKAQREAVEFCAAAGINLETGGE
ncbi:hypothetical protein ACMS1S_000077 [Cronobacter malonaticus]